MDIDEEVLQDLYAWVDQIPLSRPKKNLSRDFSDGVMMAELVKHYFPNLIELHNYPTCHATAQKMKNWQLLNRRAFKKLDFELSSDVIENIVNAKPGTMERVLLLLRTKMDRSLYDKQRRETDGERVQVSADSYSYANAAAVNEPPSPRNKRSRPLVSTGHNASQHSTHVSPSRGTKTIPQSTGGNLLQSEYVTGATYEEKVQECLAKEETIDILQAKLRRLEHLLHLKDIRIEDLQNKLEELQPSGVVMGRRGLAPGAGGGPYPGAVPVQPSSHAFAGGNTGMYPGMSSPKRHVITKYQ